MRIPLNQFERVANDTILKRGLSYYRNGHVTDITKLSDYEYEAVVFGTEKYKVEIRIEFDTLVKAQCDCISDQGSICKHIVALILYLKQNNFNLSNQSESSTKMKKSKSVLLQFSEILEKLSHKELKEFIIAQGNTNEQFKNLFLSTYSYLGNNLSKKFFQEQIRSIVNSSTDRDGFIGWHEMSNFEDAIYPIIFNADKQYADKNYKIAFYIATALMEEMIEAIEFSDDSTNVIGGIIDDSYAMLHNIVTADLPKGFKNEVLNYCIKVFQKELFEGWGWHLDILRIAYRLIEDEAEADRIIECLDKVAIEDYKKEQAELFKLQIISEYKDKVDAQRFID